MDQIGEMGRSQGAFGELVDVPADAPPLDQVLAQAGRDPGWTSAEPVSAPQAAQPCRTPHGRLIR